MLLLCISIDSTSAYIQIYQGPLIFRGINLKNSISKTIGSIFWFRRLIRKFSKRFYFVVPKLFFVPFLDGVTRRAPIAPVQIWIFFDLPDRCKMLNQIQVLLCTVKYHENIIVHQRFGFVPLQTSEKTSNCTTLEQLLCLRRLELSLLPTKKDCY